MVFAFPLLCFVGNKSTHKRADLRLTYDLIHMGWKRTLRSAAAAGRRAERAKNSRQNAEAKLLGRVDRSATQLIEKARALEERVAKDPIKALSLRFSPSHGFESEPFQVRSDLISGELTLTPDAKIDRFSPCTYEVGDAKIEILDMLILKWSTIIAFKVTHDDPTYRIKVNWVNEAGSHAKPCFNY